MSVKYFLIKCLDVINSVIQQPLQQTQRIKFTCFDVSSKYIVFGATSGGIYVFNRHPCSFLKLVPSKEGSVTHLAISPDERTIAIASNRGLVLIIDNCFCETKVNYQIFTEHERHLITAIKWHFSELYCGDSQGRVSVISLANVLSKSIFQNPSAVLMHLDSTIIQLDVHSKFLLVSTRTKTFLCDTEEEQYRQIGKKLRVGNFGGCFHANNPMQNSRSREREKSIFRKLKEGEKFTNLSVEGAKIFCSRPGLRIWEANFEASVICTYQFKNTINEVSSEVIIWNSDSDIHLNIKDSKGISETINFGKINVVANKFLLTFTSNNILLFDLKDVSLLFRCSIFNGIKDVRILDNYIYVWDSKKVKVLALMDLEMLLLKALANKQYILSSELCMKYNREFSHLLGVSQNISLFSAIKDKIQDETILEQILPYLNKVTENKVNSTGIVKVENGHISEPTCSYTTNSQLLQKNNLDKDILYRQYQVNKLYNNIEIPKLYELIHSKSLEEIVMLFNEFIVFVKDLDVEDNNVEMWCYNQYLKYFTRTCSINNLEHSMALNYIFQAFKCINTIDKVLICPCQYPLPQIKQYKPEYYKLGCDLCKKFGSNEIVKLVPYMQRYSVEQSSDILTNLPLIIQFSEMELLEAFSDKFNFDLWEDSVKLLIQLKRNICLNCDKRIEFQYSDTISWQDFGFAMIKCIGAVRTVQLLKKYSRHIPNEELGMQFYQTCIFTTVINNGTNSLNLLKKIHEEKELCMQLDDDLERYLARKNAGVIPTKVTNQTKCSSCDLSLVNPILEDVSLLCGHRFHKVCVESNKNMCCICDLH